MSKIHQEQKKFIKQFNKIGQKISKVENDILNCPNDDGFEKKLKKYHKKMEASSFDSRAITKDDLISSIGHKNGLSLSAMMKLHRKKRNELVSMCIDNAIDIDMVKSLFTEPTSAISAFKNKLNKLKLDEKTLKDQFVVKSFGSIQPQPIVVDMKDTSYIIKGLNSINSVNEEFKIFITNEQGKETLFGDNTTHTIITHNVNGNCFVKIAKISDPIINVFICENESDDDSDDDYVNE
jgi:hypothetical protein